MLFHICEHIGYANPPIFLRGCQKDFEAQCNLRADVFFAKPLMSCSAQQEIDKSYDL